MKWFAVFSIATLCLLVCMSVPAFSQDDRHDTPSTQDDKRDQAPGDRDKEDKDHDRDQDHDRAQEERHDDHAQAEQHEDHDQRGGRIPEDRFRASFGREHTFRIGHPVIVSGQPRFRYGGYWFAIAQPWPGGWLYTDPVYIDYVGGGYCLFNPVHPGIQLSINVIL